MFGKLISRLMGSKNSWSNEQWRAELLKQASTPSEQSEIQAIFSRQS